MADTDKTKDIRDLRADINSLWSDIAALKATITRLSKAQDLYVDQIHWMRGFCEEHVRDQRIQFDKLIFPKDGAR